MPKTNITVHPIFGSEDETTVAQICFYVHCEEAEALECHHPGLTDEGAPYSRLPGPSTYDRTRASQL